MLGLAAAAFDEREVAAQRRHLGELHEGGVKEECQPDAFALAVLADQVHAVVPVPTAHQGQTPGAEVQAFEEGAHAVFIQGRRLAGAPGQVVVRVGLGAEHAPFDVVNLFVEHAAVAAGQHIAAGRHRQPQIVVGAMRAHAPARGRVPPVLHVALLKLPPRAQQQVLAQQPRLGVDQGHGVLQLIAKTERPARLVEAAARPHPAGQGLVQQPAVGQHIEHRVRCLHLHRAQRVVPVLPHPLQRAARDRGPARAAHQSGGVSGVAADAEHEDNFALLARGQLERRLDRRAGVERGAHPAGQPLPRQRGRARQQAVAPDEFGAVAADAAHRLAGVEKRHPLGELRVIRIAREHSAAAGVDFGDHVHERFRAQVTEHPFHIAGGREPARAPRRVAQLDHRVLDRRVRRDVDPHLRFDAPLGVLEHAVAEAMAGDIRRHPARGQRQRRPDVPAVLVTQVKGFAAGVADRIVVPRREAEFVRVLAPGVGRAALRDDRAESRVGQHVDPRRRGDVGRIGGDHILAPVGGEATEAVEENQIRARRRRRRRRIGAVRAQRLQARDHGFRLAAAVDLVGQQPVLVAENHPRDRLQQDAVLVRNMVCRAHENAARAIDQAGLDAERDQPGDLVVEQLPIAGVVFVPDHQVGDQPFQAPVAMGAHKLAHQFDIFRVLDLHQHDRQVAGDRIAPQAGLPAPVLQQDAGGGAQRGVRVDHRPGEAAIQLRVGFAGVDLAQHHLAVGPRQLEDTIGEAPVLVLLDQAQGRVAGFADASDNVDGRRLFRLERDPVADRDDRVEHRPRAPAERPGGAHRQRVGHAGAAPDEGHALGFIRNLHDVGAVHGHQVQHPRRGFVARARAARAQDRLALANDLGLHEEIGKRRMQGIGRLCREDDLGVARDLEQP